MLVALAVLSSAPSAQVRPIVWSMLFLSATLLILYRWPWQPGTWRQPLALAGLFAVWANIDSWFLLGPLTVALVLVGELLHRLLTREQAPQADDPFPPAPPTGLLGRALVLGVVACLLNPMVLAALAKDPGAALYQLVPCGVRHRCPGRGVADDAELGVFSLRPFLSDEYFLFRPDTRGRTTQAAGGGVRRGADHRRSPGRAGSRRLRATHILLWVGVHGAGAHAHPADPVLRHRRRPARRGAFNGLSARIKLGPWSDTRPGWH